jgi:hypothetical protein
MFPVNPMRLYTPFELKTVLPPAFKRFSLPPLIVRALLPVTRIWS